MSTIQLHILPPLWGLPSSSPFCVKLETYLRLADLPYEAVPHGDSRGAPKGKLPWIEQDGRVLADSGFVIAHLERSREEPLDAWLDDRERAVAHALRRLLEENLYWAIVYSRWMDDDNWSRVKDLFFAHVPSPLRTPASLFVRNLVQKQLNGHGIGRHAAAEIYSIGADDLDAVADWLEDRPWLMGDRPCTVDASAYGMLASLLVPPLESPLRDHLRARESLVAYCARVKAHLWGSR